MSKLRKRVESNTGSPPASSPRPPAPAPAASPRESAPASETPFLDGLTGGLGSLVDRTQRRVESGMEWAEQARDDVVDGARETGGEWLADAREARRDVRQRVARAREDVESGVAEGVGAARDFARETGEQLDRTLDQTVEEGRTFVQDARRDLEEGAEEAWADAQEAANDTGEAIERFRAGMDERVQRRMEEAGEALEPLVEGVVGPDPLEFVDELEPGETHTIGGGGTLGVVATTRDDAEASIARAEDGSYTVTMGGDLGVGIGGTLGENNIGGIEGSAGGRFGSQVEYRFASAEEARRGLGLLMAQSAHRAQTGIRVNRPINPSSMSEEDVEFLNDHVSASEFRGELAASLGATFGPRVDENSARGNTLGGEGGVTNTQRVRMEYPNGPDGAPELVLSQEVGAAATGQGGLSVSGPNGGGGMSSLGRAEASRNATLERRYTLPPGVTEADLLSNPSLAGQPRETLTVRDRTERSNGGTGDRTDNIRRYSSDGLLFDTPLEQGSWATQAMAPEDGLESMLDDDVTRTETEQDFDLEGVDLAPSVSAGPFTLSGRFRNQTTRAHGLREIDPEQTLGERRAAER